MAEHKKVSVEKVKEMLDAGEDFVLLDIRTDAEFNEGHIGGAVHIPLQKLGFDIEDEIEDKDTKIVLYCRSGVRTLQAAVVLDSLGYDNVYDMGGIISWPYEIVTK